MILNPEIIFILAIIVCFLTAFGIGANDVANAMATSVGSKAIKLRHALYIAAIFEFLGAFLAGSSVTNTIRKGIISPDAFSSPDLLVLAMLAALTSAGLWLIVASLKGWPVSTTHSIVGAIIGVGIASAGTSSVEWDKVVQIALSWFSSPLLAGLIAFALGYFVKKAVLEASSPLDQAKRYVPFLVFLTAFMITSVMLFKGLKHVGLNTSDTANFILAFIIAIIFAFLSKYWANKIQAEPGKEMQAVEKVFIILMIVTACAMAFAHGSNDVANAIGPFSAIMSVLSSDGQISEESFVKTWALLLGAFGIVIGLLTLGRQVIKRVGEKITQLTPSRGFAAELAASSTVVFASISGIPISTTHTLIGAVIGVGLTSKGVKSIDLKSVGIIFTSWAPTPFINSKSLRYLYYIN